VRQLAEARSVAYSNLRSSLEKLERAHSEIVTLLDSRMRARVLATSQKYDALEQSKRQEIENLKEKLAKLPAGASREGPEKQLSGELGVQRLQQAARLRPNRWTEYATSKMADLLPGRISWSSLPLMPHSKGGRRRPFCLPWSQAGKCWLGLTFRWELF